VKAAIRNFAGRIDVRRTFFYCCLGFVLLFWFAHLIALPLVITYDGLGYIDMSDVLFSSRFPHDWLHNRTPLLPLALKFSFMF